MSPKARMFWPLLLVLVVTDCASKDYIVDQFPSGHGSVDLLDSFVRLTLVHNPGTAFGFDVQPYLGNAARPALILMMAAVLFLLVRLYTRLTPRARLAGAALGLACGGAIGNLLDRFRYARGVVDFINVGVGTHRFFVFNVADAGVTVGGLILALILLRDDAAEKHLEQPLAR